MDVAWPERRLTVAVVAMERALKECFRLECENQELRQQLRDAERRVTILTAQLHAADGSIANLAARTTAAAVHQRAQALQIAELSAELQVAKREMADMADADHRVARLTCQLNDAREEVHAYNRIRFCAHHILRRLNLLRDLSELLDAERLV